MNIPTLHTERLTLRPLALSDFETLAAFYESDRSRYVGGPKRPDETWRTLASEIGHWTLRGYGRFGVDETATGKFVGMVGPWSVACNHQIRWLCPGNCLPHPFCQIRAVKNTE